LPAIRQARLNDRCGLVRSRTPLGRQYRLTRPIAGGGLAASRQPATATSSSAGPNGFGRLEIAPSLVAIFRKSGVVHKSEVIERPEITRIGMRGCC